MSLKIPLYKLYSKDDINITWNRIMYFHTSEIEYFWFTALSKSTVWAESCLIFCNAMLRGSMFCSHLAQIHFVSICEACFLKPSTRISLYRILEGRSERLKMYKRKEKANKCTMGHILSFSYNWESGPLTPGWVRGLGPAEALGLCLGKAPEAGGAESYWKCSN